MSYKTIWTMRLLKLQSEFALQDALSLNIVMGYCGSGPHLLVAMHLQWYLKNGNGLTPRYRRICTLPGMTLVEEILEARPEIINFEGEPSFGTCTTCEIAWNTWGRKLHETKNHFFTSTKTVLVSK